jgi:hypothetical protein
MLYINKLKGRRIMSFGTVQNGTSTQKTSDYRTSPLFSDKSQGHYLSFICFVCSYLFSNRFFSASNLLREIQSHYDHIQK